MRSFRENLMMALVASNIIPTLLALGLILAMSNGCTKSTPPPTKTEAATTASTPVTATDPMSPKGLEPAGGEEKTDPNNEGPGGTGNGLTDEQLLIEAMREQGKEQPTDAPIETTSTRATLEPTPESDRDPSTFPVFTVDVSEYPSWIAFTYAQALNLLDPAQGKVGSLERKWGVDIVLQSIDYDPCIAKLAGNQIDATTITNIDALAVSEGRKVVAIFPTSTSDKADAIVVVKSIATLADLKRETTWGLESTVSHYVHDRILEKAGLSPDDFTYKMKDPQACATEMQQKNEDVRAISVWNPFKIQTLTELGDAVHVLGDSGVIPLEVLDLMVVGQDSLDREGGDRFAAALADTFYNICARMDDPATRSETLLGMIDRFAPLSLEQMEVVVKETLFFNTAARGLELYENPQLHVVMKTVQAWTDKKGITSAKLNVGYGTKAEAPEATFRYDPTYMKLVRDFKTSPGRGRGIESEL